LQIAALAPNFALQEYPTDSWSSFVERPPVGDLVAGAAQLDEHGFLVFNDNPGIGVTLREDAAEKWPYRPRPLEARLNVDGSVVDQ
jgi:galactonate dehydratase